MHADLAVGHAVVAADEQRRVEVVVRRGDQEGLEQLRLQRGIPVTERCSRVCRVFAACVQRVCRVRAACVQRVCSVCAAGVQRVYGVSKGCEGVCGVCAGDV